MKFGIKIFLAFILLIGCLSSFGQNDPDANFKERCDAEGVLQCFGFDTPQLHGQIQGTATFTNEMKVSGEGSMHVPMPPSAGMVIGNVIFSLGETFGEGSSLYLQWRQRFSESYTTEDLGGDGIKQFVIYDAEPCCEVEVAMLNWEYRGFPQFYTNVMQNWFYKDLDGGDVAWQYSEDEIICTEKDPSSCEKYQPNGWMTFAYEQHIGNWGEPNSVIIASWAREGEPLKEYVHLEDWEFNQDNPGTDNAFRTVWLGPFSVNRTAGGNPDAETWYDEFIVSTQPIADPNPESTKIFDTVQNSNKDYKGIQINLLNSIMTISFPNISGKANLSILNVAGKKIMEYSNVSSNVISWNVSDLVPGLYLVQTQDDKNTYLKKFFRP